MSVIHPTAIVHPAAQLDASVSVGPYAIIGEHVRIGANSTIGAHAVIEGRTTIGSDNTIFNHASIGGVPQDKKYAGEDTQLQIGNGNTIREFTTINIGTAQGTRITRIGDDNWIMAYVHIAHDCRVGNHTIMANSVALAGHVEVDDWAIIGGLTGVHQFTRIGAHAMVGFSSHVSQDILPFVLAGGNPLNVRGLNLEGLRRRDFNNERLAALKNAYKIIYRSGLSLNEACLQLEDALNQLTDGNGREDIAAMLLFMQNAQRGIAR